MFVYKYMNVTARFFVCLTYMSVLFGLVSLF